MLLMLIQVYISSLHLIINKPNYAAKDGVRVRTPLCVLSILCAAFGGLSVPPVFLKQTENKLI